MIRVQAENFDVGKELSRFTKGNLSVGGIASFIGIVRGENDGQPLSAMTLDHYPGMTEKELSKLEADATARWPLEDCLIIHRHGRMEPGEEIVLIATASAHRDAALESCAFLIDTLKHKAPFWKHEESDQGNAWVESKDKDAKRFETWYEKRVGE